MLGIRHMFLENVKMYEQETIESDVRLAVKQVGSELSYRERFTKDWANWTDSYLFAYGQEREKYIEENFSPTTFENQEINFILFVKEDGTVVDSRWYDLERRQFYQPRPENIGRLVRLVEDHHRRKNGQSISSGIVKLADYPALVSLQIIKDSQFAHSSDTYLVVGRLVTSDVLERLAKYTDFHIQISNSVENIEGIASLSARTETRKERGIQTAFTEKVVEGETHFTSPDGEDAFILHVTAARHMYIQALETLKVGLISFGLVGLLLAIAVFIVMEYLVVSRIQDMKEYVSRIRSFEDIGDSKQIKGEDEISELGEGFAQVMEQLRAAHEQVTTVSRTDGLSGLYNRSYFNEYCCKLSEAELENLGIVACDVDGLKLTNDMLGHAAGDVLLKEVSAALRAVFKERSSIFRLGGDEFLIVMKATSKKELQTLGNRLGEQLAKVSWVGADKGLPIHVSLGYACNEADWSQPVKRLMQQADMDMYREKLLHQQSRRNSIIQILRSTLSTKGCREKNIGQMLHMANTMGEALGLERKQMKELALLVEFHNIGYIGISEEIINKCGYLSEEETQELRRHCENGYRLAQSTPELMAISELILKHHEWWNGRGYPLGLRDEEIPIECRIFSVIDAWDSMTKARPHRKNVLSAEEALTELESMAGRQFEPAMVALFCQLLKSGAFMELKKE